MVIRTAPFSRGSVLVVRDLQQFTGLLPMKQVLRTYLWILAIVVACFPVRFVVGHSGPADWCFWAVYGVFVIVLARAYVVYRRRVSVS